MDIREDLSPIIKDSLIPENLRESPDKLKEICQRSKRMTILGMAV